jgi:type III secretory pathway component EscT
MGERGGSPGDLIVLVEEETHPQLHRDGLNIAYDLYISFPDAVFGIQAEVPTIDGRAKIKIPAGTQSGKIFLLAIQIAAPLMAISFLVNICFSVLGRAAPSLNVFVLSFPVQIFAGLTVFAMTLGLTLQYILRDMQQLPEIMLRFLR